MDKERILKHIKDIEDFISVHSKVEDMEWYFHRILKHLQIIKEEVTINV